MASNKTILPDNKVPDPALAALASADRGKFQKRKPFVYKGRTVYEWEQELEEVNIYIQLPPGVTAKSIVCDIKTTHVTVGIKGSPPYLDEDFGGAVDTEQSFWTVEDGVLHLTLQKALLGESWACACKGQDPLDAVEQQRVQQHLMLERFQRENPGFDFSQAEFSGQAPDPRTFMGGIEHTKLKR